MIRVVSWNVLADAYVKDEYYPHSPPEVFERSKRRKAVLDRLEKLASVEVMCLQEVDGPLFAQAQERLKDSAIGHHYKKRGKGEGVAIFVRTALTPEPKFDEHAFSDMSGHVALAVSFADTTIVTTHLKWAPDGVAAGEHPGLGQLKELLAKWSSGVRVICGDFNAPPNSDMLALARDAGLKDAYARRDDAFTCNSNQRKKRIDYILCSADFEPTPVPLPIVADDTPLPSESEPSDHLPIEARLDRV